MKILKTTALILLLCSGFDTVSAQMIRNRAIHFKRHRVVHHHFNKVANNINK